MEISRDKKNPTWAWVGSTIEEVKKKKYKRIIIDICSCGCYVVNQASEEEYSRNDYYSRADYGFYEIIKESSYQPFKSIEEFIEFIKTRKDMRVIKKQDKNIYTIQAINSRLGMISIFEYGSIDLDDLFNNFTWIDGSPIGIKEE